MTLPPGLINAFNVSKQFVGDNLPTILAIKGITGIISTAALTYTATKKSLKAIEIIEAKEQRELSSKEKVKYCWKYYIPPFADAVSSMFCIGGSNYILQKRNNNLVAVIVGYEELTKSYRDKFKTNFQQEVANQIQANDSNEIISSEESKSLPESIDANATSINYRIAEKDLLDPSKVLCTEEYTNQIWASSDDELDLIENHIMSIHLKNGVDGRPTTLNDVLYEMYLPEAKITGDTFGWDFEKDRHIRLKHSRSTSILNGKIPVKLIEFDPEPYYIY